MKHLVFGAGLIGSYLSAVLSLQGMPVKAIARGRYATLLNDELSLSSYEMPKTSVSSVSAPESHELFDVVWVTLKATQIDAAMQSIVKWLAPNGILITCQNGLENPNSQHWPIRAQQKRLKAIWQSNVSIHGNCVHRGSEGALMLQSDEVTNTFVKQLDSPYLPVEIVDDIDAITWAKLQLNLGNGVNAIIDRPVLQMLEKSDARWVISQLMSELLAVADAQGIRVPKLTALPAPLLPYLLRLPTFIYQRLMKKALTIDPTVRTSMWHDIDQNKLTEKDVIYGVTIALAAKAGIATPAHNTVFDLIAQIESGEISKGISPKQLRQRVAAAS